MGDPDHIEPAVAEEAREAAALLLERNADVYWRAVDLLNVISRALPDHAPGRLYIVWAALTDSWELAPERDDETKGLMREAAQEFLAISDYASELDGYLSRWYQRLDLHA